MACREEVGKKVINLLREMGLTPSEALSILCDVSAAFCATGNEQQVTHIRNLFVKNFDIFLEEHCANYETAMEEVNGQEEI